MFVDLVFPPSIISVISLQTMATRWYCGHCHHGPMMVATTEHCVNCLRRRDHYSTYERDEQSSIASNAPSSQLNLLSGRTTCSRRGIIECQHMSESLAGMPAEYFMSAPSSWYCCRCKKFDTILLIYSADDQYRFGWAKIQSNGSQVSCVRP